MIDGYLISLDFPHGGPHQKVASFSFYGELKGERDYYGGIKGNLELLEVRIILQLEVGINQELEVSISLHLRVKIVPQLAK
jgi:hypothetical protein